MATLENLQAAFNGESNAHAKYTAFAQKADQEGFAGAAALFRAAAAAEKLHAANHAKEIKKLGGTPQAKIELPALGTTAENLKVAIAGETYERDVMYPQFIAAAQAEKQKGAVRTFEWALKAEAEHARLYSEAQAHLQAWRSPRTFVVCPACGYTVEELTQDQCPVCGMPKARFLPVA